MSDDPAYGRTTPGQDAQGQPAYGQPADGQPAHGQPAYGQPTYGQPAYGQPGVGQPDYGPPAAGAAPYGQPSYGQPVYGQLWQQPVAARTNVMAILSLVFAFVFSPLAVVFGFVARKQIRERGEGGQGLATAGIIIGFVGLVFGFLVTVLVVLGLTASHSDSSSSAPAGVVAVVAGPR